MKEAKANPALNVEKRHSDQNKNGSGLYPGTNLAAVEPTKDLTFTEPKKARALYDFEAAEDNELTFKTGEIGKRVSPLVFKNGNISLVFSL